MQCAFLTNGRELLAAYPFIPKLLVILVILAGVAAAERFLGVMLKNWRKHALEERSRRDPASVSSLQTKIVMTQRMLRAGLYCFALTLILLQFDAVRSIGTGLLASAGVAGIVIGMASQNTLSNLIAGVSISFAQPVRLNDAVIFEGEFGWIEEISLMQTIIRTWDNRRVMVPNNVLVNKVVQNWTIKDPSLLGAVMLYVDYTCDVDKIKAWVKEIVDKSPNSTAERVAAVQVIDFTEKSMTIRILGKGPDAAMTWNLRCEIREELIRKFKDAGMPLPVIRVKQDGTGFPAGA